MIGLRRALVIFLGCALVLVACGVFDEVAADRADFAGAQEQMEHILPLLHADDDE